MSAGMAYIHPLFVPLEDGICGSDDVRLHCLPQSQNEALKRSKLERTRRMLLSTFLGAVRQFWEACSRCVDCPHQGNAGADLSGEWLRTCPLSTRRESYRRDSAIVTRVRTEAQVPAETPAAVPTKEALCRYDTKRKRRRGAEEELRKNAAFGLSSSPNCYVAYALPYPKYVRTGTYENTLSSSLCQG